MFEETTMSQHKRSESDADTLELSSPGLKTGPPSSQVKVEIAGATHCGHVRRNNEDHYLAVRFQRSLDILCTNLKDNTTEESFEEIGYGLLVADGMGGMAAGEVASRMALCKLVELVVNAPDWIMKFNRQQDENNMMERITERFRQVNEALRDEAAHDRSLSGMGTTLTVGVSLGSILLIGHIGDSRAYVLRGNELRQLTYDHNLAQALADAGNADPDDPARHVLHNVLTAALGTSTKRTDPQVLRFQLSPGDEVLLCTDGLTEMVSAKTIASALTAAPSSKAACDSLIDLALAAGGADNVTVLLARYQFP
jgi:PPM family protein phosphatase